MDDGEHPDKVVDLGYDEETSQKLGLLPENKVAPIHVIRKYSEELVEELTDHYISGRSLAEIGRIQGMPTAAVVYRWMKQFPDFRKKMMEAREIRALAFEDDIIESIKNNEHLGKDEVAAARLAFDQRVWAAEKSDPKTFGKKVEVGGSGAPIQIVVNTGIPAPQQPIPIEESTKIIEDITHELLPVATDEGTIADTPLHTDEIPGGNDAG